MPVKTLQVRHGRSRRIGADDFGGHVSVILKIAGRFEHDHRSFGGLDAKSPIDHGMIPPHTHMLADYGADRAYLQQRRHPHVERAAPDNIGLQWAIGQADDPGCYLSGPAKERVQLSTQL